MTSKAGERAKTTTWCSPWLSAFGPQRGFCERKTQCRLEHTVPRSCTICEHPDREAIDRALVSETSNLSVSSLFGVSESAVRRHKANHLPAKLVMAEKAAEVVEAGSLLDQVRDLQSRAYGILDRAE